MAAIAKIWRAGCIIRAKLLSLVADAYGANPGLENLIIGKNFKGYILKNIAKMAEFIHIAQKAGVPVPATSSAYNYICQMSSPIMLSAQINAQQRDYFGAHGYYSLKRKSNKIEPGSKPPYKK